MNSIMKSRLITRGGATALDNVVRDSSNNNLMIQASCIFYGDTVPSAALIIGQQGDERLCHLGRYVRAAPSLSDVS